MTRSLRHVAAVLCLLMLAVVPTPAHAGMDEAERALMVQRLRAHHILPRHEQLLMRARDLNRYVTSFCGLVDEAHLAATREAFSEAFLAFMGVQHMRFGPALVDDRHYRLNYWPDKHNQGARQLRALIESDEPVPDAAAIGALSVAVQGFPALERTLFEGGVELFADAAGARRCDLARSIAGNIETIASNLFVGWFEYAPESDQDVITGLFDGLLEQLQAITDLKLERPFGDSAAAARPRRAEAWRSGLSYAAIRANFFALRDLVTGEDGMQGFRAALGASQEVQSTADAIDEHFRYAIHIIEERQAGLPEEVRTEDGRGFVQFLINHTHDIRDFVLEIFPSALDVNVGFNALDGD